jgi:hypothetical protein
MFRPQVFTTVLCVAVFFLLTTFGCNANSYALPAFCNFHFRFPRLSTTVAKLPKHSVFSTSMVKVSPVPDNKAIVNVDQVQDPLQSLSKQASATKRVTIPSEQEVCSEILSTIQENPEFGFRRVHQALRARQPDWAIRDARVRTLLQKVREENSLPAATLQKSVAELEHSDVIAGQLEALFNQPSPHDNNPTIPTNIADEEAAAAEATSAAPAPTAPLPAGLHAPPRRDALIDASREYRDRFESLLELERSHQASEVMERLRVWPTLRLQREGLAVTGLVANPGPPPPRPPPPIRSCGMTPWPSPAR